MARAAELMPCALCTHENFCRAPLEALFSSCGSPRDDILSFIGADNWHSHQPTADQITLSRARHRGQFGQEKFTLLVSFWRSAQGAMSVAHPDSHRAHSAPVVSAHVQPVLTRARFVPDCGRGAPHVAHHDRLAGTRRQGLHGRLHFRRLWGTLTAGSGSSRQLAPQPAAAWRRGRRFEPGRCSRLGGNPGRVRSLLGVVSARLSSLTSALSWPQKSRICVWSLSVYTYRCVGTMGRDGIS